ncbi:dockerin type I repeat-containing protein [uncultured Ruminococcus sp.]|uniref:dockerin type I repeat-containing protein n=1 Tax=uncultured Ruminococcus sp. TaxID=165186 RepID=UPI00292CAA6D|nr:dockerin type I repeat-containing protein [uncultured Ruminococcus sp.]
MKRSISVLLAIILLLSALVSVPAVAGSVEQESGDAGIYGEESAHAPADVDTFSRLPGEKRAHAPADTAEREKPSPAATGVIEEKNVTEYSYEVKPLLAPFNCLFFVKTDNPDPTSFRFTDPDSVYDEEGEEKDSLVAYTDYYDQPVIFADVQYEDESTGRVAGGYIFVSNSFTTDGGKLTLQYSNGYGWWADWYDSDITVTIPKLKDGVDYLIDTYAKGSTFFDKMEAVQSGLYSICHYSGSFVRGRVERVDPYWMLARAGHYDQSYYIYSPFTRRDNRALFASSIYPYRYDSLGFPYLLADVAQRLDPRVTVEWTSTHYLFNATLDGVTKCYGGAGNIEGQGVDEKDIKRVFTLEKNDAPITLEGSYQLLKDYADLEIEDDIPRDDELSFRDICDTVGDGAWVTMAGSNMSADGHHDVSNPVFTYLYSKGNTNYISDDEWDVGSRMYWGGKMGYFTDAWVDGRYVGEWRTLVTGEKFADHPNSDLYLIKHEIPLIQYGEEHTYNYAEQKDETTYTVTDITMAKKNILFRYDKATDKWYADVDELSYGYASYSDAEAMVNQGVLDASYLEKLCLTRAQVVAMKVDRNTDTLPTQGYYFDGRFAPGTPFGLGYILGDINGNGEADVIDATLIQRHAAAIKTEYAAKDFLHGDVNADGKTDIIDASLIRGYLAGSSCPYDIGGIVRT